MPQVAWVAGDANELAVSVLAQSKGIALDARTDPGTASLDLFGRFIALSAGQPAEHITRGST